MLNRGNLTCLLVVLIGLLFVAPPATAQFGKLKDKAKKKVEKKVDDKTDKAMDDALEGAEDAATGDGKEATNADSEQKQITASDAAQRLKPGEGAWINYDFVPGDRVLYFEDFEHSPVGDFPRRIEFVEGNMEVAEWEGARYLRVTGSAKFEIPLPGNLPDDFTLELHVYLPQSYGIRVMEGSTAPKRSNQEKYWAGFRTDHQLDLMGGLSKGAKYLASAEVGRDLGFFDARVMMSGSYIKVYANESRLANVPNADFARADRVLIQVDQIDNRVTDAVLFGSLRIAQGGKKILYDELAATGRVVTQGIYFDSGSDQLRPESTPTLKEIGTMLQEHGDLRVKIEGHTDNVGEDAYNLDLSGRRAAAVKSFLVETYGIEGARLETEGFGETKPVDSNDTPEGRQNNRRVELVKLG